MTITALRATARDMRRAPVRIAASVLAIALAIAAIGVFAVPGVAESSVRSIADQDQLAHLHMTTTPLDDAAVTSMADQLEATEHDVAALEGRTVGTLSLEQGNVLIVGRDSDPAIDRVRVTEGRAATSDAEAVVSKGVANIGDVLEIESAAGSTTLEVVGIGETTWFADADAIYTSSGVAQQALGVDGINRIIARLDDPSFDNLESAVAALRAEVAAVGASVTSLPDTLEDGAHPIEDDITMVSFMIGSLGVVAGIVALILLASTANAIVTERSRDAAIMRAVGATRRTVRRDLRRLAITIGALGTIIGIPLGLIVANVIARMVLTRFAGITPDIGVDLTVMAASAAFGIVGARLVSGRVARRVAKTDLAVALRDRDGVPFGDRWSNRVLARLPTGGLLQRMAVRSIARRRARAFAVMAQFAGAVAAAVLVASLATSIFAFNEAELETYRWDSATVATDPVFPFPLGEDAAGSETGIHTWAQVDTWELEVFGVDASTVMFDTTVTAGRWLDDGLVDSTRGIVLAEKFASQEGHALGDTITVDLANGQASYTVVGLHPIRSVAMFVDNELLAADLQTDGHGDTVWTQGVVAPTATNGVATETVTREALFAEDAAARDAILAIFGAIGAIVITISVLGAASTVAMNLYERRTEVASVQAIGGGRLDVRSLVRFELGMLASAGWIVGVAAGAIGAWAIMGFFETVNAVELGYSLAWQAMPLTAAAAFAFVQLLTFTAARNADSKPLAVTLRAAT